MRGNVIKRVWVVDHAVPKWLVRAAHRVDAVYIGADVSVSVLEHKTTTKKPVAMHAAKGCAVVLVDGGRIYALPPEYTAYVKKGTTIRKIEEKTEAKNG